MRQRTTLNPKKFSMADLKGINGLILLSVVCLLLATLCSCSSPVVSLLFSGRLFELETSDLNNFASSFSSAIVRLMCGLLLPVSLLLISTSTKKEYFAKIFMFVAVGFLAVQLLSALIMAFFALLTYDDALPKLFQPLSAALSSVSGVRVLAYPIYFLQFLIRGHFSFLDFIRVLFTYTLQGCSDLLLILSNAVCGFGFMKMASFKK